MIYCTIGVPSRFSEWCEALLGVLTARAGVRPGAFVADSLDQIGHEMLARLGADSILVARQPRSGLLKSLIATGHPFIVTLDSPDNIVSALMVDYGISYTETVRRTASCLASLVPAMKAKNALFLRSDDVRSVDAAVSAIGDHFGLELNRDTLAAAETLCPLREPASDAVLPTANAAVFEPPFEPLGSLRSSLPHRVALQPLWDLLLGEPLSDIVWNQNLFWLGDKPSEAANRLFDVTGSSRCLLFGPYIRLPEGPWSCTVTFGFSQRAVGLRLVVDVFAGMPLNLVNFEVNEPGVFEIEFSFVNSNPDLPVEVRLFNADAAFEGEIFLGQVRMAPLKAKRLAVS